jgi:hypothetical protein
VKKLFPISLMILGLVFVGAGGYTTLRGFDAKDQVRDQLAVQQIVLTEDAKEIVGGVPGATVKDAKTAEQMAKIIDFHALESTGGLRYAEMGRFSTEDGDPAGTSDAAAALKGADGKPVPNGLRNTAFQAAALQTSLYSSVMAFNIADLVVGLGAMIIVLGLAVGGVGVALEAIASPAWARRFHTKLVVAEA